MAKPSAEYDALYTAVCAAPDEDTPKLVFADWLDEHDDPHRAAYIRAEVQLNRLCEADPHAAAAFHFCGSALCFDWPRYHDPAAISPAVARLAELSKRRAASAKKAETRWKAVLGKRKVGSVYSYTNGFPSAISVSNGKQYAEKQPPENLPGYTLSVKANDPARLDALLACRNFAAATGFSLSDIGSPEAVRKLGARPAARNFRSLVLNLVAADPAILAAVATEPNWLALTYLSLHTWSYTNSPELDLPEEFARAKHLRTLTSFRFGLRALTGMGLVHLTKLGLPRLRRLDIHYNRVEPVGALALTTGDFPELRHLDAGSNTIRSDGAAIFADCKKKLAKLASLNLGGNDIADSRVMAGLIAGPAFPVLVGLSLRDNRCRELDAKVLATEGRGPTLRFLSLRHCLLSAKAAAALATAPSLAHLACIDLAGNEIGDAGAAAIAQSKWDRLTCLDLGGNGITAEGVKALVAWPGVANLTLLDLGENNPIGVAGAKALAGCAALRKCRKLIVPSNEQHLPAAGRELLQAKFGKRLDRY